jgi:hypothetical protein
MSIRRAIPLVLSTVLACSNAASTSDMANNPDSGGPGSDGGGDGAVAPPATSCTAPAAVDTSHPDITLGAAGQPACTQQGLQAALDQGGVITFNCGGTTAQPFSLALTSQLTVDQKKVVLDGANAVVLAGGGASRILRMGNTNFEDAVTDVTVQHLAFTGGHTTDVPNTTSTDQGGAAIYRIGGALTVIDCQFTSNTGPVNGQDVAGGAIYSIGGGATIISGSTFDGNSCSNGGALGNLGNLDLTIVNSTFTNNHATGTGANPGNGGNGGAISFDGSPTTGDCNGGTFTGPATFKTLHICGAIFQGNGAGAIGGALFRTADSFSCAAPHQTAPAQIDLSIFDGNTAVSAGAMYLHQVDLTMTNSTVSNNQSGVGANGAGGGLWLEGSDGANVTLALTNVTVAKNQAHDGLGGGFFFGADIGGGTFSHVSIVQNSVTTASGNQYAVFGAGTAGDPSAITLSNSIVADNAKPAASSNDAFNCEQAFKEGGGNVQHIAAAGGQENQRCTADIMVADPKLDILRTNPGPFVTNGIQLQTVSVASGSAAAGLGTMGCAPVDETGFARQTPCTAGAYEAR